MGFYGVEAAGQLLAVTLLARCVCVCVCLRARMCGGLRTIPLLHLQNVRNMASK